MRTIKNKNKTITIKELSEQLKLSIDTITNCVKRLWPNRMKKGVTTFLDEKEVSEILKHIKNNKDVKEKISSEVTSEVEKTTTSYLEKQEIQTKSLEGVEAIKKLDIKDQYRLSMQIQQNILQQLSTQNQILMEQNNKIFQLNLQLQEYKNEHQAIYERKYKNNELRAKINRLIRKIAKEQFNGNYKKTWDFYLTKYSAAHCFTCKQTLQMIIDRHALQEFYELLLNI